MTKENVNIKPTFLNLWPTVFMQLSLPGHESANPVLADLILSKNVEVQNMTENYNEDNSSFYNLHPYYQLSFHHFLNQELLPPMPASHLL